jgi:uncharacterized surface protein with fasciclin (FAS1) repeats
MTKPWLLACAAIVSLSACNDAKEGAAPTSEKAAEAAGDKTLATGLGNNSKFAAAIKSAGLEGVLAGPTPYTLLVPNDAAFDKLPAAAREKLMSPAGRKDLTAVLTNHILPGTMLAADIGKAVESGGGKTQIATLGGGALTATRSGEAIVIADTAGTQAKVVAADNARSNGVIHTIDAILMPAK